MEDILLGLLPVGERAVGRAWLRGAAVPIAGLVSSLLLAALAALGAGPRIVAGLAFVTASGGLAVALVVRRQHRRAALALARSGDLRAGRAALPAFGGVDASVTEEIVRRLATSEDDEQLLLVSLLADLDPAAAANAVAALLPHTPPTLTIALLGSTGGAARTGRRLAAPRIPLARLTTAGGTPCRPCRAGCCAGRCCCRAAPRRP